MRRSLAKTFLFGVICAYFCACNQVDQSDLPQEANAFLTEHFSEVPVDQVLDTITELGYTVILENGSWIEFDENGDWEEINFKKNNVPVSLLKTLPDSMYNHLTQNYQTSSIKKITKKSFGRNNLIYRVNFNKPNNIELSFTKDGELISNDPEDKRLPSVAKKFIESQFQENEIQYIVTDVDGDIEVTLDDRTDITFDRKGNWFSVKGRKKPLPENFLNTLPKTLNKYIEEKHPEQFIRKIEKKSYGYRVKLNKPNDVELSFTKSGILIDEDDENE